MRLSGFNLLGDVDAARLLSSCAAIESWVDALVAERPYPERSALLTYAEEIAQDWTPAEVDEALAHHPRIGERATTAGPDAALSAAEQSGVDRRDVALLDRLAAGNRRYEDRFGRVYLVRAAGRSAPEMLALLEQRLTNDDDTETRVVAGELREIALLRLGQAVETG